jgi:serralysin
MPYILPDITESADATATTATPYNLGVGQTAQGTISSLGDHDWYRISLVAGQTYTFAEIGTGTNSLNDTFLNLRDSSGTVLASDDDAGPGLSSSLTFTATSTGTYYVDAGAFGNGSAGQYGISATLGTRPNFNISMGAGAVDAYASWSTPGTGAVVTYGFRQSPATYTASGSNISTFTQVSAAEMAAVQTALQLWSDVAGVTFQQVNPGGYTDNATILIGNYFDANDGAGAFAYYPGSTASTSSAGDVWLNLDSVSTTSLPVGGYSFLTIMHELGHTLGLSHPGDYNAAPNTPITYANNAQFVQDSEQYSVMSYFGGFNTGESPGSYGTADTPMMFDIYELQAIYGANMTTRVGDTVYGFGSNAGSSIYNFSVNTAPQFCIWDAGGNDTLNCSGYSLSELIDLNAGDFSNIDGETGNVSISLGVTIENATGGSGNDTIIGNSADNTLNGGGGADAMIGGTGNDTYYVDNLGDTIAENLGEGTDRAVVTVSGYTLAANVETGIVNTASGITLTGNGLDNVLWGNDGNDTLIGGAGNDILFGSNGADTMIGGIGDDIYYVDNLADTIIENPGEGSDTANVSVSGYTLAANVEVGIVTTTTGLALTGNSLDNVLWGNSGNDTLNGGVGNDTIVGGAGADTMIGGTGNDIYYADNLGDTIVENPGEGSDAVNVTVSGYTLAANVEVGVVFTTAGLTLTGNSSDNVLWGNSGNDTLNGGVGNDTIVGGAGADTMIGGTGNDTYYVDNLGDTIVENPGEGSDAVYVSVSGYTLAANVEEGIVNTTTGITLTGNGLDNILIGNTGNDTLDGGTGNDMLTGGAGNDIFVFRDGSGNDTITDFTSGQDVVDLTGISSFHTLSDIQTHAAQVGANTVITVDGSNSITLAGVQVSNLQQNNFLLA